MMKEQEQNKHPKGPNNRDSQQSPQQQYLIDVLFVLDAIGSTRWCIREIKKAMAMIIGEFDRKVYDIRFGVELYWGHWFKDRGYVEKHFDLREMDEIAQIIDEQWDVGGGEDKQKAMIDGLVNGLQKTSWRVQRNGKKKSKRFLFHGSDTWHEFSSQSAERGCTCGLTIYDVKQLLDSDNVDYFLIQYGSFPILLKQCFGERLKRYFSVQQSQSNDNDDNSDDNPDQYDDDINFQKQQKICHQPIKPGQNQGITLSQIFKSIKNFFRFPKQQEIKSKQFTLDKHSKQIRKFRIKKKVGKMEMDPKLQEQSDSDNSSNSEYSKSCSIANWIFLGVQDGIKGYVLSSSQ